MKRGRLRIHWAWVPAGVFYLALNWYRYGPVFAILTLVAAAGLVVYVETRASRRRAKKAIPPERDD